VHSEVGFGGLPILTELTQLGEDAPKKCVDIREESEDAPPMEVRHNSEREAQFASGFQFMQSDVKRLLRTLK
jgi:hypothetical protein